MNTICKYFLVLAMAITVQASAHIRMGIASSSEYCGEREIGWRIKIAAEQLGWTAILDEKEGNDIKRLTDLDWVICLLPRNVVNRNPKCPNYLTIFHPFNYLDGLRRLLPIYRRYDGYLMTIDCNSVCHPKTQSLNAISFYPSTFAVPYTKVELNNLVTMIPVWSERLHDARFRTLYNLLSNTGKAKFYGTCKNPDFIAQNFMGNIPFDGCSVINVIQNNGIVLVLHSNIHNIEEIPTGRIFEAAAASAVIISDQNEFVKTHFGDSVYYINTEGSGEEMYAQVMNHLNTIWSNPEAALEKAKKAHEIFMDNFEMSTQLLRLEQLHEQIKLKKPT